MEPPPRWHQPRAPAAGGGRQQRRQQQQQQQQQRAYIGVGADGRIERHGAGALAHDARAAGDLGDTWRSMLNDMKRNAAVGEGWGRRVAVSGYSYLQ